MVHSFKQICRGGDAIDLRTVKKCEIFILKIYLALVSLLTIDLSTDSKLKTSREDRELYIVTNVRKLTTYTFTSSWKKGK